MANAIETYFSETGDNVSKLAERIGRAPSSISRPLRGERNASMSLARDIERGTEGRVTASQFLDVCLMAAKTAPLAPDPAPEPAVEAAP